MKVVRVRMGDDYSEKWKWEWWSESEYVNSSFAVVWKQWILMIEFEINKNRLKCRKEMNVGKLCCKTFLNVRYYWSNVCIKEYLDNDNVNNEEKKVQFCLFYQDFKKTNRRIDSSGG